MDVMDVMEIGTSLNLNLPIIRIRCKFPRKLRKRIKKEGFNLPRYIVVNDVVGISAPTITVLTGKEEKNED